MHHKWQSYNVWFLRYGVWWTQFFVILDRFLTFHCHNNPKNQNFEKLKKKSGDIIILHKCTKNHDHICYAVPWIWHVTDIIVIFHFGLFFALLTPKQPKKSKFKQNEKSSWRYNHFTYVPKIMIRWCTVPEIWCTTDGQTDRQTEKVTYRGGCPT